jgi:glycosyltransferase involved in cell wall biosynthesis
LLIIGKGRLEIELKEMVKKEQLQHKIHFLGFQKNEAKKSLYQVYQKTKAGKKK